MRVLRRYDRKRSLSLDDEILEIEIYLIKNLGNKQIIKKRLKLLKRLRRLLAEKSWYDTVEDIRSYR